MILRELFDNAFKFSGAGQLVIISLRQLAEGVTLKITDAGRGFSQQQLELIGAYTQFERPHHEQQGIGLGLALVKRVLDYYQYPLEIQSIAGRYTQILIKFSSQPAFEEQESYR